MKFDPGKTYPHPVLRPGSRDYPRAEFQVEIEFRKARDSTESEVDVEFSLSDADLSRLVAHGYAQYVLVIRCPKTHFRFSKTTAESKFTVPLGAGSVFGRTEFSPFLVAVRRLSKFRASGWHEEYAGLPPVDIEPGAVLAVDTPKEYTVDNAEEAPIGSIFELDERDQGEGRWDCDLERERVAILMSGDDRRRFEEARRSDDQSEASYIMNSIYLPALYHVLVTADAEHSQFEERRWFRSLDARIEDINAAALGKSDQNRLHDAQLLLQHPFANLPFMKKEPEK